MPVTRRWRPHKASLPPPRKPTIPPVLAYALLAYGIAHRDADPAAAYEALRRGLAIAQESGNRWIGSQLAMGLASLAAHHGDPLDAFDYFTLAIRNYYDSGNFSVMPQSAGDPRRLLRPARTLRTRRHHSRIRRHARYTQSAYPAITTTITHLREVLGDQTYESLARKGETMTTTAMATYAYDQIDQARAELNAVSK